MPAQDTGKITKTVKCPKCGSATKSVKMANIRVNRCLTGCGIWINQTELDSKPQSRTWLEPSIGERPIGLFGFQRFFRL